MPTRDPITPEARAAYAKWHGNPFPSDAEDFEAFADAIRAVMAEPAANPKCNRCGIAGVFVDGRWECGKRGCFFAGCGIPKSCLLTPPPGMVCIAIEDARHLEFFYGLDGNLEALARIEAAIKQAEGK